MSAHKFRVHGLAALLVATLLGSVAHAQVEVILPRPGAVLNRIHAQFRWPAFPALSSDYELALVEELRAARKHEYPLLMLHENDLQCGGCDFATFFDGRTPIDLIQGGLYSALALAVYPDEFLPASAAVAATALGARVEASLQTRFMSLLRRAVPDRFKQDFDSYSRQNQKQKSESRQKTLILACLGQGQMQPPLVPRLHT